MRAVDVVCNSASRVLRPHEQSQNEPADIGQNEGLTSAVGMSTYGVQLMCKAT